jgi:hypothetical protein
MKRVRTCGFGHVPRPRNFAIDNKLSSEDSLANCHWQFSPAIFWMRTKYPRHVPRPRTLHTTNKLVICKAPLQTATGDLHTRRRGHFCRKAEMCLHISIFRKNGYLSERIRGQTAGMMIVCLHKISFRGFGLARAARGAVSSQIPKQQLKLLSLALCKRKLTDLSYHIC